jgi:hypothetical protein
MHDYLIAHAGNRPPRFPLRLAVSTLRPPQTSLPAFGARTDALNLVFLLRFDIVRTYHGTQRWSITPARNRWLSQQNRHLPLRISRLCVSEWRVVHKERVARK